MSLMVVPVQRRMIYFPSSGLPDVELVLPGAEVVSFETSDGLVLAGWFLQATLADHAATVIVFNGNGGNRSDRVALARALGSKGYSVLLFDYRGYGQNPGRPSEDGLLADGQAAVAYLDSRGDVDHDRIVYFGESLGAAVAIGTALLRSPAVLVLRSPFTSLPDAASVHFPFLPASVLLTDRYPNEDLVGDIGAPVLVIAGSEDRTVPQDQSERVFAAAQHPKRLVVLEGSDHNDQRLTSGSEVVDEVATFIESALPDES